MEEKVNVAEILKDKPRGIKLYSMIHGKCSFEAVTDEIFKINFCTSKFGLTQSGECTLIKFGNMFDGGECIIFPSKEMRDWSKFAWKKGDVLVSNDGGTEVIFDKWYDDTYTNFYSKYYLNSEDENNIKYNEAFLCTTERYSLENKDSVQTYINTIEERLDGKLNIETLEIEKTQPEFKDGDILCTEDLLNGYIYIYKEPSRGIDICYCYKMTAGYLYICNLENRYDCVLPSNTIKENKTRFATDSEKQQLFDALAKEGKAWDSDKKQIVDLPKKCEFKPMDWCLMRDIRGEECFAWSLCQFAYQLKRGKYEAVGGMRFDECIPYNEETKHLLGTTDEWKGGEG